VLQVVTRKDAASAVELARFGKGGHALTGQVEDVA
jgi:hypothetical protein